ncbi:uncharacterized protein LOC142988135 [Genypterus blacodes]|uniref:uncharacterized protein LOC142988135 n=1 Tax=Genypterus blacodes TaxID=154954 RepID=UPI003F7663B2
MQLILSMIVLALSVGSSSHQTIQSVQDRVQTAEGDTVTLSCNYTAADSFFWYQQFSSSSPQLLITEYSNKPGLTLKIDKVNKRIELLILSAAVTDSAVYYCAVTCFCVSCEELTAVREGKEEFSLEGSTVTLSYNYSKGAAGGDSFFWYRQNPGNPPQFLILISGSNFVKYSDSLKSDSRFSTKLSADKRGVDLLIPSAAVTDSAVYYCAVKPTVTVNPQALY